MVEEMKSLYIEKQINAYVDGVILPEIDLSAAKREVRRSRSRRRGKIAASVLTPVLSAVAAFILVIVLAVQLVPAFMNRNVYSVADATSVAASYASLSEEYPEMTAPFAPFSLASNASAEYSVYEIEGAPMLMRVELAFVGGGIQARASVYVDLTNGVKKPKELTEYQELSYNRGYRSETVYEGGEYVTRAYCTLSGGVDCYVDMTANNEGAFYELMKILRR